MLESGAPLRASSRWRESEVHRRLAESVPPPSSQDERLLNLLPLAQHGCELQLAGSEGAPGPDGDDKPAAPRVGRPRRARLEWEPVTDAMLESCGMQRPLTDRSHWARRMALPIAQPSPDVVRPLPFTLKDLELFEVLLRPSRSPAARPVVAVPISSRSPRCALLH